MKIIAIWERPNSHPRYGLIFILLDDGRFLTVNHERISDGKNNNGERRRIETGNPEYWSAFNDEDRFDFEKADFFIRHFGGKLLWSAE